MRVVGVVDLLDGRAVHARAGDRERYEPVSAIAGTAIEAGDAAALARAYRDRWGLDELYVADLDAILGKPPQDGRVSELADLGRIWLDAGVSSVPRAAHVHTLGIARAIVGLETLRSWEALREITAAIGGDRVSFSLDLRDGRPIGIDDLVLREPAAIVAARAADAGVESMIVLDLQKVGTSSGPDLATIGQVRQAAPDVMLLAGGGVRTLDDVRRLADCGCGGVLIATALHRGTMSAADVQTARTFNC